MKKTFKFGLVDYEKKGIKKDLVKVEITLEKNKKGDYIFSAVGEIGKYCFGQCLDTIAKYVNTPIFNQIYEWWKIYHLNDLHPECEHQRALGWEEIAKKEITKYSYILTDEAKKIQENAEKKALNSLKNGETFTPTLEETKFFNLPYFLNIYDDKAPEFYQPYKSCIDKSNAMQTMEIKTLGWVRPTEQPQGLLGAVCPVCGYKFGYGWQTLVIPDEVLKEMLALFNKE